MTIAHSLSEKKLLRLEKKAKFTLSNTQPKKALRYFGKMLKLYSDNSPQMLSTLKYMGCALNQLGHAHKAMPVFKHALSLCDAKPSEYKQHRGTILFGLANSLGAMGELEACQKYLKEALESASHPQTIDKPLLRKITSTLGYFYNVYGKFDLAQKHLQQSVEMLTSLTEKEESIELATVYSNMGMLHLAWGNLKEAATYLQQSFDIRKNQLGEKHIETAICLNNFGILYSFSGNLNKAIHFFTLALRIRKKHFGFYHPSVARTLSSIAYACLAMKKSRKAKRYFHKAKKIRRKCYNPLHPENAKVLSNAGIIALSKLDAEAALKYFSQALENRKKVYHPLHPNLVLNYYYLAKTQLILGSHKQASLSLNKAIDIFKKLYGFEKNNLLTLSKVSEVDLGKSGPQILAACKSKFYPLFFTEAIH